MAEDVRRAVSVCRYSPIVMRGHGSRRPLNYGRVVGADHCQEANKTVLCIVQIQHMNAASNLDEILLTQVLPL